MKKVCAILFGLVVLGVCMVFSTLNGMVALDEMCNAKWSQVLNQYQRRADLIPNLMATVMGYARHEQETFIEVVEARAKVTQTKLSPDIISNEEAMKTFMQNQGALSTALSRLLAVVERYPDLKSNENFMALQSQLEGTENRISVARRDYIDSVRKFNTKIRTIPTKWIVEAFSDFEKKATFDIDESKKEVPQVDFSK